jgi:hypothetical protein
VADWATQSNLQRLPRIVSGLAENTNSIFCEGLTARDSKWMSGSAKAGTQAERHSLQTGSSETCSVLRAPPLRARRIVFSLDNDLHGRRLTGNYGLLPVCA